MFEMNVFFKKFIVKIQKPIQTDEPNQTLCTEPNKKPMVFNLYWIVLVWIFFKLNVFSLV